MKIPLYKRGGGIIGYATVDRCDFATLKKYRWCLNNTGYARTSISEKRQVLMHRMLLGLQKSKPLVDHVNRNKLDNQRKNLRIASASLNTLNRNVQKNNTTGTTGVTFRSRVISGKTYAYYIASIRIGGKTQWLGHYKKKEDAIHARKLIEKTYGI